MTTKVCVFKAGDAVEFRPVWRTQIAKTPSFWQEFNAADLDKPMTVVGVYNDPECNSGWRVNLSKSDGSIASDWDSGYFQPAEMDKRRCNTQAAGNTGGRYGRK